MSAPRLHRSACVQLAAVNIVFGLLCGCSGDSSFGKSPPEETEANVLRAAVRKPVMVKMDRGFELSGELRAWQQADLHARIPGYLKLLKVDIGSRVQSNQLLAVLEAPELDAERVEAAAAVERSVSEEVRSRASLQHARAQVEVA